MTAIDDVDQAMAVWISYEMFRGLKIPIYQ